MTQSSELERRTGSELADKLQFAKALATATTLPPAYRNKPGDVLLGMEYADALGIPRVMVFTSIHVIDGTPSMSAELMSGLVRKAGHSIRIRGDNGEATCVIVRKDDPDFAYSVTFTMADARQAKLVPAKPDSGWTKYPRAMLRARAISECCRQACADVLAGVSYTPDELGVRDRPSEAYVDAVRSPDADVPLTDVPLPTQADANEASWVDAWQIDLAQAVEQQDLGLITELGNKALNAPLARVNELIDQARTEWTNVRDQLAAAAGNSA
jgi:hypothetical protein